MKKPMLGALLLLPLIAAGCGESLARNQAPESCPDKGWIDEGDFLRSRVVPGGRIFRYASPQGPIAFVPDVPDVPAGGAK